MKLYDRLSKWLGSEAAAVTAAPNYDAEEAALKNIRGQIEAEQAVYLDQSLMPTDDDFALIGKIIQTYCYADINARRIINAIRHAAIGPEARNAGSLTDADVYPKLREAAAMHPPGNVRDGLNKAADSITTQIAHRHIFAHWTARRVPNYDALVLFTKNEKEGKRRAGHEPKADFMTFSVIALQPWRIELGILGGHARYLAEIAYDIETRYPAYKKHFDGERAAIQAAKYAAGKTKRGAKGPPI